MKAKALKVFAAVFAVLLAISACSAAPKGGTSTPSLNEVMDQALDKAVGEVIGDLGNLDGFTRNDFNSEDIQPDFTAKTSESFFMNAAKTEVKTASVQIFNGTVPIGGETYVLDNKGYSRSRTYSAVTEPSLAGLSGWEFYKLTCISSKDTIYNPKTKEDDVTNNRDKGSVSYCALQEKGAKLSMKMFERMMPADKTAFDATPAKEFTKK